MITRDSLETRIRQVLAEMFEIEEEVLTPEAHLYEDLDLDSLDAIDLAVKLKSETGIKLTEQEMKSIRTVRDISDVVYQNLQATEPAS